ncbi:MAG TPA: endonuclease/exonuclease/phosphatase family protein, partial [Pirellulaceae bacterium]|nr:endonuclease/exonuclease/phosphatase family protein [Pirellulaceae bacterium]
MGEEQIRERVVHAINNRYNERRESLRHEADRIGLADRDALVKRLEKVAILATIDDRWREAIEELGDDYPFSIYRPRSDNFGIALLSRHVIRSERVASLDDSGVPTIIATVDFHGQPLNVVGTHPLPPIGRRRAALRDQHLARLGEVVLQLPHPTIVLGDLNVTSWSPCFRDLLKQSDLQDSRLGFGVQPTWPSNSWLLRIPIDHALVSRDLIVTERFVGPDIGSDHRPIVVEFARASR